MKDFKITLLGEILFMHPLKAIFWERPKILLIADLHLGKAAHFRKSGIPIPEQIHQTDLDRISELLSIYEPKRIIFLGDLFHSAYNAAWISFKTFCNECIGFKPDLVLGNHDILEASNYDFLDVHKDKLRIDPFIFSHEPLDIQDMEGYYNFCGHIHPSVRLSGTARQSLRIPCFYFGENHAILPAFGNFTGTAKLRNRYHNGHFYAIANQKIIRLN